MQHKPHVSWHTGRSNNRAASQIESFWKYREKKEKPTLT